MVSSFCGLPKSGMRIASGCVLEPSATNILERLNSGLVAREFYWTEAVAVGSEYFVKAAEATTAYRRHMERYEMTSPSGENVWAVHDTAVSYNADSTTKSAL